MKKQKNKINLEKPIFMKWRYVFIQQGILSNTQKDVHRGQETNACVKWDFKQRDRKYFKSTKPKSKLKNWKIQ